MTKAGGVMTDVEVDVIKLWAVVTYWDYVFYGILGVVALFYLWYFHEAYVEWKRVGNKWFSSFLNICQVISTQYLPGNINICQVLSTQYLQVI
jgi:hypothetical protein